MLLRSEALFGAASTPDDWRWGRIHTLTLAADLITRLTPAFDNGPWAVAGNGATVNVAAPRAPGAGGGSYDVGAGASMRMVVEAKESGMEGHFQLPGGQTHRKDSPNYDDLLAPWLRNEHFRMPFTRDEAIAAAQSTFTMSPVTEM